MPVQFRSIQSMSVNDRMKKLDQFDHHHHSSSTTALHRGPTGVALPTSGRNSSSNNSNNISGATSSSSSSSSSAVAAAAAAAAVAAFRMPSLSMPLNMPISLAMASVPTLNNLNNLAGFSGLVHSSSSGHLPTSSAAHQMMTSPTSQQQCNNIIGGGGGGNITTTPASVGSAGSLGGSGNSFTDSDSDPEPDNNEHKTVESHQQRRPLTNNSSTKIRTNLPPSKCDGKSFNYYLKRKGTTAKMYSKKKTYIQFDHRTIEIREREKEKKKEILPFRTRFASKSFRALSAGRPPSSSSYEQIVV